MLMICRQRKCSEQPPVWWEPNWKVLVMQIDNLHTPETDILVANFSTKVRWLSIDARFTLLARVNWFLLEVWYISSSDTHNTCSNRIFVWPPIVTLFNLKLNRKYHDIWWAAGTIRAASLGWHEGIPTTQERYCSGNLQKALLARLLP